MNSLTVILSLLVASVFGAPLRAINEELDSHWEMYKETYKKQYNNEQIEYIRRLIWEDNLRYIQEHNLRYDMGHHTYTLGLNRFADMTNKEFKSLFLSSMSKRNATAGNTFMAPMNVQYPSTVDWRKKGYVTPVKDQGQCGSCWAFSTTGSLEGQYFRKTGNLVSFSEQELVDCSGNYGNMGCNGGLMDNAFKYLESYGAEKESVYPYKAVQGSCRYDSSEGITKVSGFTDVPQGDENALKAAVATVGPVSVAIDAGHISFQLYRGGVYNEPSCSSYRLDHGVLAVGYGSEDGQDYWLVKNSWNTVWGMKGYIKMSRNRNNQCGIATQASYPNM